MKNVFIGVSTLAALLVFGFLISQFTERSAIQRGGNALTGRYLGYAAGIFIAGLTAIGTYHYATGCWGIVVAVMAGVSGFFFLFTLGYAFMSKDS